ncbi:hypothetical protein GCM10027589_13040 [Actinocorallia lasiicapitis]
MHSSGTSDRHHPAVQGARALPDFVMPLPAQRLAPGMRAAEHDMWLWLRRHRMDGNEAMREHLNRTRPAYTSACYYPDADSTRLRDINRLVTFDFLVDDVLDDAITTHDQGTVERIIAELVGVTLGRAEPASRAGHALSDAKRLLTEGRSPGWKAALDEVHAGWLRTYPAEAALVRAGGRMTPGDYLRHRRWSVNEFTYLHLQEYALGVDLPAAVRDLPAMRQARARASEWIGVYNDVFSAEKEDAIGYPHNLVVLVRTAHGCTRESALATANDVLSGLLEQFLAACSAVPAQVEAVVPRDSQVFADAMRVVNGYRQVVRGNFDYHFGSPRYNAVPGYLPAGAPGEQPPGWTTPVAELFLPSAIPTAPGALPLLGHLPSLARDPLTFMKSLPARGDLVRIRLGRLPALVVCDPDLTWQVLHDDRTFDKGGPFFDRLRETLGDGIGTCPHSLHRRQRRLVQPAFHPARLPGYAAVMTKQISGMTDTWQDGRPIDVLAQMAEFTARTTVETMFSDAIPPQTLTQTTQDISAIFDGWYRRMLTPPPLDRLPTPKNRRYHQANARLRRNIGSIIAHRRATGEDLGDLLSPLLNGVEGEPPGGDGRLTDAEIADQLIVFYIAGTQTTAATLAWALWLIARHPEIEARLHQEVDTVLDGGPATYERLARLTLTGNIVTETLRLWGPGWFLTRTVPAETRLRQYTVPAGSTIVYSPYLVHHDAALYDDPESFAPDRWDDPALRSARHALIPFGSGARKCIGDSFATVEAVLALATVAARWRLCPEPGQKVRPARGDTLRPRRLIMRAEARRR